MSSFSNLTGLLQKYMNPGADSHATAEQDFQQVSQNASPGQLAGGLTQAFQSNQTPAFPQMISTLFQKSNGQQQAGILNQLLGSLGPAAATSALGGMLGGATQVTPQQAQQVSPDTVHQLAQQAHQNDPSIIQQASNFYAQHPTLVQALGAGSLAMIMSHMSRNA